MRFFLPFAVFVFTFICKNHSSAQPPGNSLQLGADTNYVSIRDSSSQSLHDSMTWEFWFYNTCESDGFVCPISKGWCNTAWSYYIAIRSDSNQVSFFKYRPGGVGCYNDIVLYKSPVGVVPYNTWTHIALVMFSDTAQFYINGQAAPTTLFQGTPVTGLRTSPEPVLIGAYHSATVSASAYTAVPKGNIDDVRIWHKVRTPAEIAGSYQSELSGTEDGLAAYYKLNETGSGGGITVVNSAATTVISNGITTGKPATLQFVPNSTVVNTTPSCALYFQSRQTGNWNDPNTWETSPKANFASGVKSPATKSPNVNNSFAVTVRTTHRVNVNSDASSHKLTVEPKADIHVGSGVHLKVIP